jgi:DNA-directed RNA polymerase specialized sigma24 family protein
MRNPALQQLDRALLAHVADIEDHITRKTIPFLNIAGQEVDDARQNACLALWQHLLKTGELPDQIVKNVVFRENRRPGDRERKRKARKRPDEVPLEGQEPLAPDDAARLEHDEAIGRAVDQLPAQEARVVRSHIWAKAKFRQIAGSEKQTLQEVRRTWQTAKRKLALTLANERF